jgi:hypothetical protein
MRTFTLNDTQVEQYSAWQEEHRKTCKVVPDFSGAHCKVIFVPSGLGDSATVECFCGEKKYLDDGVQA